MQATRVGFGGTTRARRAAALAAGALLAAGSLGGCGGDGGGDDSVPPSITQVGSTTTTRSGATTTEAPTTTEPVGDGDVAVASVVAASLHSPIDLVTRAGDDGHVYVAERAGRVLRMAITDGGDGLEAEGAPLLDLTDQVSTDAERGLLGIAFSPDGATLYASLTNLDGDTRVLAWSMVGDAVDPASRRSLFAHPQPYPNHNGGGIRIGPDGKLWLGLGDGGSADDPENRAQDPSTDLGKVVRIDPTTGRVERVISGVRNPWRWAFDTDGSLWIADVGQGAWEEIDHLPAGRIDGTNLGWSGYEGTHENEAVEPAGRRPADWVRPVFEYSHDNGNCAITGGFVYRGAALPELDGAFLFADYCAGRLRAIRLRADGTLDTELDLGLTIEAPIAFGQDQAGEPYVLSAEGNVTRLVPAD
jgi:glucose/arabinose dehydrogenase